jgi:hypothetical protein
MGIPGRIRTTRQAVAACSSGDRLRLKLTIGSKRRSSRAGRGHVDSVHVLMRQDDMAVFSVELALLMATRTPA